MSPDFDNNWDRFGCSVSISENFLAVGTEHDYNYSSGRAYIFYNNGGIWEQQAKLTALDGANDDRFGYSVSINGDYAIVGSDGDDDNGSGSGSAYIFHNNAGTWGQHMKLTASDGTIGDSFGKSVSIYDNYAIVGSTGDDDNGSMSGSAYIFSNNEGTWEQQIKLTASEGIADDYFGNSVSISDNYAFVGAEFDDDNGSMSGSAYIFSNKGIVGKIYNDISEDCINDANETGLTRRKAIINPGNIIVETGNTGTWYIDSLTAGEYTITADTTGKWLPTCPLTQNFTVVHPDSLTIAPSFGFVSTEPCAEPNISVNMPFMRPCFSNQKIYVQACNTNLATGVLPDAYVELELDSLITPTNSSIPYADLGDNLYRFDIGTLNPGMCEDFWVETDVSCDAELGQTLCMQANLFPADSCIFDTIPTPPGGGVTPCEEPWDKSSLSVEGWCQNDSVYFTVTNTGEFGEGDMVCWSAVRIYIDGVYTMLDSVMLAGGETQYFIFSGYGRTWRLEADQHPLHPGNSHPNATVELCGNPDNWTPDLVNILPHNDADPVVDIYCGLVTGSYDPNDKACIPVGVGMEHFIYPDGKLDYTIRFQNTGTDTAFTVIIRDTLETDLDIFTVQPGASSHECTFRMHGPRVLEWTFYNILLPDSNVNEPESHGFVSFTVNQVNNLPDGTEINNNAGIYFDYNDAVITNIVTHIINRDINSPSYTEEIMLTEEVCDQFIYNEITYTQSGTYWQVVEGGVNTDTLVTLNLTILESTTSSITVTECDSYTAPDGIIYTSSGIYTAIIPNAIACDSIITIDLTILESTTSNITVTECDSYTAPDGSVYTSSGIYTAIIPNSVACDSIITIDLTIYESTTSSITVSECDSYTAPDGTIYTSSGIYTAVIPNAAGCDSTITIDLTILESTASNIIITECDSYTAPDGSIYTSSGIYTAIIPNAAGCDSTITIDLTINTADVSVTVNDPVITANAENATYQWVDCDNDYVHIQGETGQSFTATVNGSYAVIVTQNTCTDTSECVTITSLGISRNLFTDNISIYPNPTDGLFTINFSKVQNFNKVKFRIKDITGNVLIEKEVNRQIETIDLSGFANGIYIISIQTKDKVFTAKLIKE